MQYDGQCSHYFSSNKGSITVKDDIRIRKSLEDLIFKKLCTKYLDSNPFFSD